mgnify:CR=1 FL=1
MASRFASLAAALVGTLLLSPMSAWTAEETDKGLAPEFNWENVITDFDRDRLRSLRNHWRASRVPQSHERQGEAGG